MSANLEENYVIQRASGTCYRVVTSDSQTHSYDEASLACATAGDSLVALETADKASFVRELLVTNKGKQSSCTEAPLKSSLLRS